MKPLPRLSRESRPLRWNPPATRNAQHLWRWCLMMTLVQQRRALQDRRPISLPNLMRLFERHWRDLNLPAIVADPLLATARQRLRAWRV